MVTISKAQERAIADAYKYPKSMCWVNATKPTINALIKAGLVVKAEVIQPVLTRDGIREYRITKHHLTRAGKELAQSLNAVSA